PSSRRHAPLQESDASMSRRAVSFAFLALLLDAACTQGAPIAPTDVATTDDLIKALGQRGLSVTRARRDSRASYPFFSFAARRLRVNGDDVFVFEYPDTRAADADASKVSPAGTPINGAQIMWVGAPRFYKRNQIIVL